MTILDSRKAYKPLYYPWAYELYKKQHEVHWTPDEILNFQEDVADWKNKLTEDEKYLLTQLFKFFTQADIDVASGYIQKYLPQFKHPELQQMMLSFAAMEGVHVDAYSKLIDVLGLPETEYSAFLDFQEMKDKHEYLWEKPKTINDIPFDVITAWAKTKNNNHTAEDVFYYYANEQEDYGTELVDIYNLAYDIAKFSAFSEGLQLFSSFAMLMNFPRHNKMKAMGSVVEWSIRDESIHVVGMSKIFQEIIKDYPWLWTEGFKQELKDLAQKMVELEFAFIDFSFKRPDGTDIEIKGLDKQELKDYIKYTCNQRLELNLMCDSIYPDVTEMPLKWLEEIMTAYKYANFFETRGTSYAKGTVSMDMNEGDW